MTNKGFGTVNTTQTQMTFGTNFVGRCDGVCIFDLQGELVAVAYSEFSELEQAYLEACDKRDSYENMLIEAGLKEREYSQEELFEIERQRDRDKIDELSKAVSVLIAKSEQDSALLEALTNQVITSNESDSSKKTRQNTHSDKIKTVRAIKNPQTKTGEDVESVDEVGYEQ